MPLSGHCPTIIEALPCRQRPPIGVEHEAPTCELRALPEGFAGIPVSIDGDVVVADRDALATLSPRLGRPFGRGRVLSDARQDRQTPCLFVVVWAIARDERLIRPIRRLVGAGPEF